MKIKLYLSFAILLTVLTTSIAGNTLVDFKNINLEEAKTSGQKIFVSFSADWCLPCKIMEESLYNDSEIASFLNENFTSIKADVDSNSGNLWNELYNVNSLPTVLFAFEDGNEIERFNGNLTKQQFLDKLKIVLEKDRYVPIVPKPKFALQLGAFANSKNANKMIGELNKLDFTNHLIVEEFQSNGDLMYKVVLIDYVTRKEAIEDLDILTEKGLDGFVRKNIVAL